MNSVYVVTAEWKADDPYFFEVVGVYKLMTSALRAQDTYLRIHFHVPDNEMVEELRCPGVLMRIEQTAVWD